MSTIRVTNIQAIGASDPALVISGASVIFNSGLVIESGITIGTDVGTSGQFIMSQGSGFPVVYSTPVVDVADDIEVVTITATGTQNTFVSGFDLVAATTGDFREITAFEENNGFIRTFSGDFHDLVVGATGIFGAFTDNPTLRVQGNSICESGVFFVDETETAALKLYATATNTNGPNIVIGATGVADGSTNRSNIAIGFGALSSIENARSNNIAIGTNALLDATAGANNVAIGGSAGQNIRPGGNSGGNTFIGQLAAQGNNDTSNNTQDCTIIGQQAAISIFQGRDHVAIGKEAMRQHQTALESGNVCVGANAFRDAQEGELNTVIGHHAAEDSTGGDENVFVCAFSGQNNTASGNVAIGVRALNAGANGTNNVAVGRQALQQNSTGRRNVSIGVNSLNQGTACDEATAIGFQALQRSTASGDIGIGNSAGNQLTSGGNNTIIGSLAGTAGMADTMLFGAGTTERFRVDSTGRLLFNTQTFTPANISAAFVGNASDNNQVILALGRGTAVTGGARSLGSVFFTDSSGDRGASIDTATSAGWTASAHPTVISFSTCAGNTTTPTPRMRIDENGVVEIGGTLGTSPNIQLTASGRGEFEDGVEASDGSALRLENSAENQVIAINASGTTAGYTLEMPRSAPSANDQVLTVSGGGGSTNVQLSWAAAGGGDIPQGTVMLFFQASAPTGFTQVTTQNNKALRVVSGTGGGTGGDTSFTNVFGDSVTLDMTGSVGATTLTIDQIPSHTHFLNQGSNANLGSLTAGGGTTGSQVNTSSTGGGQSHTHSLTSASVTVDMDLEFIDILLASKD